MIDRLRSLFNSGYSPGYDATVNNGRRRQPPRITKGEDDVATQQKRRILQSSARDLARNFAIAAWAIRKHLDYVASFSFQATTPDSGLNAALEQFMASAMSRQRFDVAQRHPFKRAVRLAEACRVKDGDVAWIKLTGRRFRGQIQAIESDRIRYPDGEAEGEKWTNGVQVDEVGRALAYAICKRDQAHIALDRIVPARSVLLHAGYERFDQVRGISPMASALNWFRDTYEGFEYALAKAKVAQLFGLSIYRDAEQGAFPGATTPTLDADGDGIKDAGYEVALGKGPFMLDLDPGDRAEILESATPAAETVEFLKLMIHVALKSLDIPYSFFDESFTNFYGSRGGLIQYLKSCRAKIRDLQQLQTDWGRWRLGLAVVDGEFVLPSGMEFNDVSFEFIPDGVPWWDPVKEVNGHLAAVGAGFTSPQRVCREVGTDYEENIREIAEAQRIATDAGVSVSFAVQPQATPEPVAVPEDEDL